MAEPASRPFGWRWIYAAAWLSFLSFYVAVFAANGSAPTLALRAALSNVLPEALLGVLLLRVPRRLPWPSGGRGRFFLAHGGLLATFVLAANAGWLALWSLDRLLFEGGFGTPFDLRVLPWRVLLEVLVYCTLVGVSYAWANAAAGRELMERLARAEALRLRAELEAMRSQLNPHFILNTFHALLGLVRRDPELAERALERLGDLLRHSLRVQREGIDQVPLREEWAFVESYLELERLRLGERLRTSAALDADTLDELVPSFALQTLVENAVRHGIAPRAEGGWLAIAAQRRDGVLRLAVGNELAAGSTPRLGERGGLRLLADRLHALYDGRARLDLRSDAGGLRAVLELPLAATEEPG